MSNATASSAAPSKMAVIARWTLQGLVAAAFLAAGAAKLAGMPWPSSRRSVQASGSAM